MSERGRIIVLDGHDGAGKTTLAFALAEHLGGRNVSPFQDLLGDMIAWLWRRAQYAEADSLARAAIVRTLDINADADCLVFDRHWLCMFTVLPEQFWSGWFPLPLTILCWADVQTTQRRLSERGEDLGNPQMHQHFCRVYRDIALKFGARILDTSQSTPQEALRQITRDYLAPQGIAPRTNRLQ